MNKDLGGDYTLVPIPKEERKHWIDVALVWMGLNICPPTLLLGVWLIKYQSFKSANFSLLLGLAFLAVFSIIQGIIGTKTGLPTYPLSQLSFGELGGKIFSFLMFVSLIGWFGILTETMVSTFYLRIFPEIGFKMPLSYKPFVSFFFGTLITIVCFFGFKAITWLNRIVIPSLLLLSFFALYKIIQNRKLILEILKWSPTQNVSIAKASLWVIGSLIIAAVTAPDFNRYCKKSRDTIYSVVLGNVPIVYFLTVMGMAFAVLSGAALGKSPAESADLSTVFIVQKWNIGPLSGGFIATFVLIGAIITTNVSNLYPGAMALVTVFKGLGKHWKYLEDRAVLTIFVGIMGSIFASFGILSKFEKFLELLSVFSIPILGIMSIDFYLLKNRKIKNLINLNALGVWLIVSIFSVLGLLPGGTLFSIFYAGISYYILEKTVGANAHIKNGFLRNKVRGKK